jgi:uncharacterized protein DUF1186/SEC-C motif-containing protein
VDNILLSQCTIPQIIVALNQRNKVPEVAIKAAIARKEEMIPVLLAILKYAAEHYQKVADSDDIDYIIAMYILAKLREPQAFHYIIQLASLDSDWPERLLGDVITEALTRFLVSTYDGNVQAIKNLIENTDANMYCRSAALSSLLGLYAVGKLYREEIIKYYRDLLRSPLVEDEEFAMFLLDNVCEMYPDELYDDAQLLFDKVDIDEWSISKENFQEALDMGLDACLQKHIYTNEYYAPIDDVVEDVSWLYSADEEECAPKPATKIGRNDPCPCDSGKKYKKCCLDLDKCPCC